MYMHHENSIADAACACTALRKASRALSGVYDAALADTGITIAQFSILRHIWRGGDIPLSRLAEQLVMDRTSLYRALTPLERHGWVSVVPAPEGRARIASLTDAGHAAMLRATGPWEAAQTHILGEFGVEDWQTLETMLRTLTAIAGDAR
ncbi:MarR family winged helix-turn-helix transcriptional regulator [Sphingomonas sp.]|uniref:MarR family winged helix-turn-helix transcriptional regulator n=1 Tax=Sphingomonas sp. TaxID=28214 RepID=UPI003D6D2482